MHLCWGVRPHPQLPLFTSPESPEVALIIPILQMKFQAIWLQQSAVLIIYWAATLFLTRPLALLMLGRTLRRIRSLMLKACKISLGRQCLYEKQVSKQYERAHDSIMKWQTQADLLIDQNQEESMELNVLGEWSFRMALEEGIGFGQEKGKRQRHFRWWE